MENICKEAFCTDCKKLTKNNLISRLRIDYGYTQHTEQCFLHHLQYKEHYSCCECGCTNITLDNDEFFMTQAHSVAKFEIIDLKKNNP